MFAAYGELNRTSVSKKSPINHLKISQVGLKKFSHNHLFAIILFVRWLAWSGWFTTYQTRPPWKRSSLPKPRDEKTWQKIAVVCISTYPMVQGSTGNHQECFYFTSMWRRNCYIKDGFVWSSDLLCLFCDVFEEAATGAAVIFDIGEKYSWNISKRFWCSFERLWMFPVLSPYIKRYQDDTCLSES